ncbi:MAG: 50S ribosomal protein L5 [Phycisphaerae bacterium]
MARIEEKYKNEVLPALQSELGISNPLAVPRLTKIVVSIGMGSKANVNKQAMELSANELALITGQKAIICNARTSVSNFKLRRGMPIGLKVTLRGKRMYEFFDRLVSVAIPRVRDFRGLNPKSFDGRGNYNMGITEQTVFPEVPVDKVQFQQGMNLTMCTTGKTNEQAFKLLSKLGMPFRA